jgi:uncharacterized protein YkwD
MKKLGIWIIVLGFVLGCKNGDKEGKPDVTSKDVGQEEPTPTEDTKPKTDVTGEKKPPTDGFTPIECDPQIAAQECTIFNLINQWRQEVGKCQPFTLNVPLSLVAREHMAWYCNQPQQPEDPVPPEWENKAVQAVPNQLAMVWRGGFGSAPKVMIEGWKEDQGMVNSFMNCDYNEIGIGYAGSKGVEGHHCNLAYNIGMFLVQTQTGGGGS